MSTFDPADPSPETGRFGLSRRNLFAQIGAGVGSIGMLSALRAAEGTGQDLMGLTSSVPHFVPKAKRIIHLFMNGGPFQADFFDPSPR